MEEWFNSPYKILSVGRKGRKTTFDVNELFLHAMVSEKGLTFPYIGPTRTQAKEIVWDDHVKHALDVCKEAGMKEDIHYKVNNSELSVKFLNYGKFVVDGSDNIESLRGKSDWGGVVLDEFASWRNKRYAWEEVIEPNLSVHEAWAVISGTPKGYDYFHRLIKMGDHEKIIEGEAFDEDKKMVKPHRDFISYRFTSYDNPHLSRDFLESKKERLTSSAFNQEYLARFEKFTGLVYKDFNRTIHVKQDLQLSYGWQIFRAMDFGATNATVCLWIAVDNIGNVYVFDEYYQNNLITESHAKIIQAKTPIGMTVTATYGDPSAHQSILDYANYGLMISPALKVFSGHDQTWVLSGISKIQEFLKPDQTGSPKLFISSKCSNLIREFESYHWLEQKEGGIMKDIPEKTDDHCMDALRYFFSSYFKPEEKTYEPFYLQPYITTNPFTGYSSNK